MFKRSLAAILLGAAATVASAGITANLVPYSDGVLSDGVTEYSSWDLQVTVTGDDAWTVAGGASVGVPWAYVVGGTFYQDPVNDGNPPNPAFIPSYPDSQFTSFYTTHTLWPNTDSLSPPPGFASGPADTPTELVADWYWLADGRDYPGTFTIARLTVLPDGPDWCMEVNVLIGSDDVPPYLVYIGPLSGCCEGDFDGDSDVDLTDLAQLLGNYGTTAGAKYWDGDLDGDGDVDLTDLAELLTLYGTVC